MNYFVKAEVEGQDVSPYITSFTYEDCVKEDDLVSIELQGVPMFFETLIKAGAKLKFQFGYYGGSVSALRLAKVQDIEYKYNITLGINLTALDEGQVMKKELSKQVWENRTASQIAVEIAKRYGLKTDKIETTSLVYEHLPQANRSDFELLQYLANREVNGSYQCCVKDDSLVFSRLALEQNPIVTLNYGKHIVSFSPSFEETSNGVDSKGIEIANFDPITQTFTNQTVGGENTLDHTKLGTNDNTANKPIGERKPSPTLVKYNANGDKI